ncbi:hypothetical protein D3C83_274550 [compost metagenome]
MCSGLQHFSQGIQSLAFGVGNALEDIGLDLGGFQRHVISDFNIAGLLGNLRIGFDLEALHPAFKGAG